MPCTGIRQRRGARGLANCTPPLITRSTIAGYGYASCLRDRLHREPGGLCYPILQPRVRQPARASSQISYTVYSPLLLVPLAPTDTRGASDSRGVNESNISPFTRSDLRLAGCVAVGTGRPAPRFSSTMGFSVERYSVATPPHCCKG